MKFITFCEIIDENPKVVKSQKFKTTVKDPITKDTREVVFTVDEDENGNIVINHLS